jgi:NTP pyrophosphatase (non-canonical NTP hydrolase)
MTFDKYQAWTKTTAVYPEFGNYPVYGLAEEVGEVMGIFAKYERGDFMVDELKRRLRKELGDVLWMLARVADDFDMNLSDLAEENKQKILARMEAKTIRGDGDDR